MGLSAEPVKAKYGVLSVTKVGRCTPIILSVQVKPLALTLPPARGHVKFALPVALNPAGHESVQLLPPTKLLPHAVVVTLDPTLSTEHLSDKTQPDAKMSEGYMWISKLEAEFGSKFVGGSNK